MYVCGARAIDLRVDLTSSRNSSGLGWGKGMGRGGGGIIFVQIFRSCLGCKSFLFTFLFIFFKIVEFSRCLTIFCTISLTLRLSTR